MVRKATVLIVPGLRDHVPDWPQADALINQLYAAGSQEYVTAQTGEY
jgi:hypothetical protein